jgi:hypothetical protein
MVSSLLLFLIYSIPALAGWWFCFRAPLGRRRFHRSRVIPAPADAVWRVLDPRGPGGGWSFLYETRNAVRISDTPLVLELERRPRHSHEPFTRVEEECRMDDAAHSLSRVMREPDGASCDVTLAGEGSRTTTSVDYETRTTGLLASELTRLALARDHDALADAVLGRDAMEAPLFRFSGWRLALLGVVSGVVMAALVIAPGFYVALKSMGVSFEALLAEPGALGFLLALALAIVLFLSLLLIAATLVHELGHALALAAFGHRGITVSLIPFCGGVGLGARACASAFEAGVVSLAGPALSAVVALAILPDPSGLSALMQGLAGEKPDYAGALVAFSGATFALLTLLLNIPNVLPWTGSDGALALGAIFPRGRTRQIAAGLFATLLALVFAGIDDLAPFGLMFVALSWFNRKRPETPAPGAPEGWRPMAVAAGLALVVGLYAHEAAMLRSVDWLPPAQPPSATEPT